MNVPAFLIGFSAAATAVSGVLFATNEREDRPRISLLVFLLASLFATVTGVSVATTGENSVVQLFLSILKLNRVAVVAFSAGCGFGTLSAFALCSRRASRLRSATLFTAYSLSLAAMLLIVLKNVISPYLPRPDDTGATGGVYRSSVVEKFRVVEVTDLTFAPTSVTVGPDGNVYIAGLAGMAYQNGVVARVDVSADGDPKTKLVAGYLNRPHGLAFYKDSLYVSRAGQHARAVGGKIIQQNTGAVTRLRDLDGDGRFDQYEDIVKELPGAQQPDGMHQNNGIAFDAHGNLYITVGAPSDHGPSSHPLAGSVLKCRPDGSQLSVFARGFRNPFGICIGPSGEIFATDNDSSMNAGDELNHVRQGRHYGHPYTSIDARTRVTGAEPALLNCKSAQGLAFAPPGSLPAGFDNALYIAAFGEDCINRVTLTRSGDTFTAKKHFFAKIPGVVDVAISKDGVIYAVSHYNKKLYRIVTDE